MITKQALGNTLFGMADILRDKVEDYKSYILTLLFFKRLSDNYTWETEEALKENRKLYGELSEKQVQRIIADQHDFKIPEGCFWEDVKGATIDKKNEVLHIAVNGIADANPALKGIINSVRWNEPAPDGSGGKRLHPEVLSLLINYLSAVELSNKNASVDVLGDAYEYLIGRFADENRGGTMAGQFYTPQEVVDIIVRYLKPQKHSTAYDPTCGSGGFLINAAKYCKHAYGSTKTIRLYGQEDVWNTWAIANINAILHGLDAEIKKGDTLRDPKFLEEDGVTVKPFNLVMANFPFSAENWWKNGEPKRDAKNRIVKKKDGSPQLEYPGKETFSDPCGRFEYGTPPFSNGDFAFLQHIVASIEDGGRAGVVCPQGVLFRGQPEKTEEDDGQNRKADDEYLIRRGLVAGLNGNAGIIDAIVVLPANLFYGTTIPGAILFINKAKPAERKDKILMVYAAREGWYQEKSNMNVLLPHDMLRISTILESWGDLGVAQRWISSEKGRLHTRIQTDLEFKLGEIDEEFDETISSLSLRLQAAKDKAAENEAAGKKLTAAQLRTLQTAEAALRKIVAQKEEAVTMAHKVAEGERKAIDDVEEELLTILQDPEQRKRYFAVVDQEELKENEYILNIPRYVDTFEPEEEINLDDAIAAFKLITAAEADRDKSITKILTLIG